MKNEITSASKADPKASTAYNSTKDIELQPIKSSILKIKKETSKDEKAKTYDVRTEKSTVGILTKKKAGWRAG